MTTEEHLQRCQTSDCHVELLICGIVSFTELYIFYFYLCFWKLRRPPRCSNISSKISNIATLGAGIMRCQKQTNDRSSKIGRWSELTRWRICRTFSRVCCGVRAEMRGQIRVTSVVRGFARRVEHACHVCMYAVCRKQVWIMLAYKCCSLQKD